MFDINLKAIFGTFIDIYCDTSGIFAFISSSLCILTVKIVFGLDIASYFRVSVIPGAT